MVYFLRNGPLTETLIHYQSISFQAGEEAEESETSFLRPLPPAEYAAHLAASRHPHPHPPTHQRASRRSEAVASGVSAPGLSSSSGGGGAAGGLVVPGTTRVGGGGGDAESNVRGRTTEGRPVERSEPAVIEFRYTGLEAASNAHCRTYEGSEEARKELMSCPGMEDE
ncbi:unnamed protein product [Notodromas monacha]|uniref:Uncharacterized protein n=1 Tax=Notodromas monacha TaxID=399045 RepID=A0A7R9BJ09_9CRUS|nr:unnamed protein product [Notodromas monacha]CAG0916105.1 unnamed protein product [Notodromas monacha]